MAVSDVLDGLEPVDNASLRIPCKYKIYTRMSTEKSNESPRVEHALTGRGKCKKCKQPIVENAVKHGIMK